MVLAEVLTPFGVRFELLRLIERTAGAFPLYFFLTAFLTSAAGTLTALGFGFVGLLYCLPAFALTPVARGWLRWLVLPVWCVLDVFLVRSLWMSSFLRSVLPVALRDHTFDLQRAVALGMSVVLIGLCIKRLRPFLILSAIAAATVAYSMFVPERSYYIDGEIVRTVSTQGISMAAWRYPFSEFFWSAIVFHVAGAFVLFRWALRERAREVQADRCTTCNYALAGIQSDVCPECGESIRPPESASV